MSTTTLCSITVATVLMIQKRLKEQTALDARVNFNQAQAKASKRLRYVSGPNPSAVDCQKAPRGVAGKQQPRRAYANGHSGHAEGNSREGHDCLRDASAEFARITKALKSRR